MKDRPVYSLLTPWALSMVALTGFLKAHAAWYQHTLAMVTTPKRKQGEKTILPNRRR